MELTRERREARLRPLSLQGVVAVVTGFIGATGEGAPTTLGRLVAQVLVCTSPLWSSFQPMCG